MDSIFTPLTRELEENESVDFGTLDTCCLEDNFEDLLSIVGDELGLNMDDTE